MRDTENTKALNQILDFIRLGSIILLLMHFYSACYPAIRQWHLNVAIIDRLVFNLSQKVSFLSGINKPKVAALFLLTVSLMGGKGKKDEKLTIGPVLFYVLIGLLLYFISSLLLLLEVEQVTLACLYISVTVIGYLSILSGGAKASRLLFLRFKDDVFNEKNETFPQEERKLENEFSINLPAQYILKGKIRRSFINVINPFRALLVLGTPGSRCPVKVISSFVTLLHSISKKGFHFLYTISNFRT